MVWKKWWVVGDGEAGKSDGVDVDRALVPVPAIWWRW